MPGLGWRQDLERREELHGTATPFVCPRTYSAPDEILHPWLTIHNQGNMGSCSGHAISTCCEVLAYIQSGGTVIQYSRMFGYLAGQTFDNLLGSDNGATITGSVRGAVEMGSCLEDLFPYPQSYTRNIPSAAKEAAKSRLVKSHSVLKSYDDCYKWLATGTGDIEIGISWTASFADNKDGVIEQQSGQVYGGHALAVVGYTKRVDNQGRKYLLMINSHGEGWGKMGRAEVAPALFDKWGKDRQSELIGVRDQSGDFGPRKVPTYVGMVA
jgi:hypothetical protein